MLWNFGESRFFGRFSLNLETSRRQQRDASNDVEHGSARPGHAAEQRPAFGHTPQGHHHPFESWIEGSWPFFALFITVFVIQNAFGMVSFLLLSLFLYSINNIIKMEMPDNRRRASLFCLILSAWIVVRNLSYGICWEFS
jgi:hypothetical protein